MKAILKEAVEYCKENGMEISFTSPGWVENSFCECLGINPPTCGAYLSNMAITPSGNVVPCQSWLNDDTLGNFLKDDWDRIWSGDRCRIRREYSAKMEGLCPLRKYREDMDNSDSSNNSDNEMQNDTITPSPSIKEGTEDEK